MFDTAHQGVIAWPFTLTQQHGDEFVDVPVTVRFRVFNRDELRERDQRSMASVLGKLVELVRKQADPADIEAARIAMVEADRADEGELVSRIAGWSGFGNAETGEEVAATPELVRAVIAHDPHYQAMWKALLEASRQARPKNSLPGADGAPAPGQTTTG